MLKKSVLKVILILFSTALLTLTFNSAAVEGQGSEILFSDHFDGSTIDTAKWSVQSNGGSVTVANSYVSLSSDGSSFPLVTSAVNPFPASGDFAIEFDIQYTRIEGWGTGFWISKGPFEPSENNLGANVMQVWAQVDGNVGAVYMGILGNSIYKSEYHWNPYGPLNSNALRFRLQCTKGLYTVYLNGVALASIQSPLRPDTVGFGHPPAFWVPRPWAGQWTSFKINSIRMLQPSGISLSTTPSAIDVGLKVDMSGTLTDQDGLPLRGAGVLLSYQIPIEQTWNALTSVITDTHGYYAATWFPPATGNFLVKAEWIGDATYAGTYETKNVSVTRGSGATLFLAESNSTLSSLAFDSVSNEISFTVSGSSGTSGYVRFLISKTLMENLTDFTVYLDGQQINYHATSKSDFQELYFEYTHSTHNVIISLSSSLVPEFPSWISLLSLIGITLFAVSVYKKKQVR